MLRLTRIEHSFMLVIAVLSAELITKALPSTVPLILSAITPISISAAAFAINDYFDIDVDKINRKVRPLVKGTLQKRDALYTALAGLIIGVAASLFINVYCLAIAAIFAALSVLYSYRLKEYTLLGNAYIAFSMSIPYIFGNYVVSSRLGSSILLIAAMIFLSGMAREIHGTIRDYKGDTAARGARTLPSRIGHRPSAIAALLLYSAAILISAYLFMYVRPLRSNAIYLGMITLSDLFLIYVSIGYLLKKSASFYSEARNLSLAAMALALFALFLAPIYPLHLFA